MRREHGSEAKIAPWMTIALLIVADLAGWALIVLCLWAAYRMIVNIFG